MREGIDREDAPGAEGGWLTWLADCGIPALSGVDTRALVRHIRAPRRDARRGVPGGDLRGRGHGARPRPSRRWTAATWRARSRPAEPVILGRAAGPRVVALDTGIKDSIVRNLRERGATVELHPCDTAGRGPAGPRPRRRVPRQRPRRPGGARLRRRQRARGGRARCRCGASASATSCCAGRSAWRPSSCPSATAAPTTRSRTWRPGKIEITSQNHGFAVLGPNGEQTVDTDEPLRWETDFGAAELSQLNLYDRTVEGLVLRDVPGLHRPVPPRGRPRAPRRPAPVRPLPGAPGRCLGATTSRRSSSSARARS